MREIKFRAWDVIENRMFYVSRLDNSGSYDRCWEVKEDKLDSAINPNVIITQYTTIKDKNGKDIYEGDFIRYKYGCREGGNYYDVVLVEWSTEGMDYHPGWVIKQFWGQYGEIEIIGNIYENPEMINLLPYYYRERYEQRNKI